MVTVTEHDLLILGSGLAGLRAALEAAIVSGGKISIGLVSKVQLMRSHSVAAEGGTAAVLRTEEGDSFELHAWDTVKGSDFLADQDVVSRFVRSMPEEIWLLEHQGIPWSRRPDGRIDQRPFGGHSFPRAVYAADKTGFFEMQTLYDALTQYDNVTRYDEWFVTSILTQDGQFSCLTALDITTGNFHILKGKALIIASGGSGRLSGFTTYSYTATGDGVAMAYRAGVALKDMEFVQFHPTGLVPSGILITEACRGEGGYLLNNKGERFMEKYAPKLKEIAPRDIISRSIMTEINEGRGFKGERGMDYVRLDLTHLGAEKINERLGFIRELCIKFVGIDPVYEPIPIRPVWHYLMGGIHTDITGATAVRGIWAAGECACVSLHGANRLGANSTAECLVWGKITGAEAARYVMGKEVEVSLPQDKIAEARAFIFDDLLRRDGKESLYKIRAELQSTIDNNMWIFRDGEGMQKALNKVRELKERYKNITVRDKSRVYNTDLVYALELGFMLDVAEVMIAGGLQRQETRGAHARVDFKERDDVNWLKHTLAFYTPDGPRFDYCPVTITTWKPVPRTY